MNAFARLRRAAALGLLVALCLQLAGCGAIASATKSVTSALGFGPKPVSPDWGSLTITAAPDANQNSAVAVDVVFVREQTLVDTIVAMPAARWFASRDDMVKSFPDGVGVLSYELVPRQSIRIPDSIYEKQKAYAVFAFASYPPPGDHRERLKLDADAYLVVLGPKGFKASEVKPTKAK